MNGSIERWNRTLKKSLRAFILESKGKWNFSQLEKSYGKFIDQYNLYHIDSATNMTSEQYLKKIHIKEADLTRIREEICNTLTEADYVYQEANKLHKRSIEHASKSRNKGNHKN